MCTSTFWFLLVWNGKAELLAPSVIFVARVKAHLVGRCRLDMSVKDSDVQQPTKTVSNYLVPEKEKTLLLFSAMG